MIIDFHTHTFPQTLAKRAVDKLAKSARAKNYLDGTAEALCRSMAQAGIDYSVLLPVATKPEQQEDINRLAADINAHSDETGLFSFGGIHPENTNYRQILRDCRQNGIPGIKLHPIFQQTPIDDIRYLRIIECACENQLIILVHAGYDISHPDWDYSSVPRICAILDRLTPDKFVLAHMGGWQNWDAVASEIAGRDVWLGTSFSLLPIAPAPGTVRTQEEAPPLGRELFLRIVREHGADRILFGTDSPWSPQLQTINALKASGLTGQELNAILGENGAKLLSISQ